MSTTVALVQVLASTVTGEPPKDVMTFATEMGSDVSFVLVPLTTEVKVVGDAETVTISLEAPVSAPSFLVL